MNGYTISSLVKEYKHILAIGDIDSLNLFIDNCFEVLVGHQPTDIQKQALHAIHTKKQLHLVGDRQTYKTTISIFYSVYQAVVKYLNGESINIFMSGNNQDSSNRLIERFTHMYERLPEIIKQPCLKTGYSYGLKFGDNKCQTLVRKTNLTKGGVDGSLWGDSTSNTLLVVDESDFNNVINDVTDLWEIIKSIQVLKSIEGFLYRMKWNAKQFDGSVHIITNTTPRPSSVSSVSLTLYDVLGLFHFNERFELYFTDTSGNVGARLRRLKQCLSKEDFAAEYGLMFE